MSRDIDTKVSQAIIRCAGRPLGVRPLTTYVNSELPVPVTPDDVQHHVSDLESKGAFSASL